MRFLVTGATGLIGRKITSILIKRGDQVNALTTNKKNISNSSEIDFYFWNPELCIIDEKCFKDVDVVINLAGSPIAQLWTKKAKKSILESRLKSVKLLERLLLKNNKIKYFVCASAIGIYPSNMDIEFNEESKYISNSFLGNVVNKWEESCQNIENHNIKVLKLRIGLVLSMESGLLKPIAISTKYFLGCWFGMGNNYYSWIHIDDIAQSIIFLIDNNKRGIYNLVSPNPIKSKTFVLEIANIFKSKVILPGIPYRIVKFFSGNMSELLIFNQKVSSEKLILEGFKFKFPDLRLALKNLLK